MSDAHNIEALLSELREFVPPDGFRDGAVARPASALGRRDRKLATRSQTCFALPLVADAERVRATTPAGRLQKPMAS